MSRKQRALAECAPITEREGTDRAMRIAILHAGRGKRAENFKRQQAFDQAMAALAQKTTVPDEIAEWFEQGSLVPIVRRTWKKTAQNPAVLSVGLAVVVIAGVFGFKLLERLNDFPGSSTARKLLTAASSARSSHFDSIQTEAGTLGDLFFMKYRLEHYDVPPEFAEFKTAGYRVFDDDEGRRVAHVSMVEKRMQFFLFPVEKKPKDTKKAGFEGWRYIDHEGWTGAVQVREGVGFMAAIRGSEKNLTPYIEKPKS